MSFQVCISDHAPIFGKYQRMVAIAIFVLFQFFLYFFAILPIYAILTLNYELILGLACIVFLQSFASRSEGFVHSVNNVLQLRRYAKKIGIFYQEQIEDKERCMFGLHPHSALSVCLTASMNLKNGPFSNIVGLSSRFMLACPIVGFLLRLWGVQSVDNKNMKRLMKQGRNIMLVPGGFEEATITCQKQLRVFIKNRKGFIKYAIENNYSIFPAIYLGQHRAFWTFDYFIKFRLLLNKLKLPAVFFWNFKTLLFLPPYLQYYAVIGKRIKYEPLQAGQIPSQDLIDQVHKEYIEQLVRAYEKYKHLNGDVPIKIY